MPLIRQCWAKEAKERLPATQAFALVDGWQPGPDKAEEAEKEKQTEEKAPPDAPATLEAQAPAIPSPTSDDGGSACVGNTSTSTGAFSMFEFGGQSGGVDPVPTPAVVASPGIAQPGEFVVGTAPARRSLRGARKGGI